MAKAKILVVDDEDIIRQLLSKMLTKQGYDVELAEDGLKALEKAKNTFINLVITDLKMPKADGMSVLQEIKKVNPHVEVIVLTGYPTIESAVAAIKVGAFDFICKPFDITELERTVKKCLDRQRFSTAHVEAGELDAFSEISRTVASDAKIENLLEKIMDTALTILKAERGSLMLWDEDAQELRIKVARGLDEEIAQSTRLKLGEGVCGKVLQDGKPIMVTDASQYNPCLPCKVGASYRTKSFLVTPLISRANTPHEKKLGVINITDKYTGEPFTEREERLLLVLAAEAVTALENYQLYSQLQEKVVLLESTVKQLEDAHSQLIQSEKMAAVGQLAFGIAHEIRNPLGIILGGVDFLKGNMPNHSELITMAIDKIKHSVARANTIILELLKFSRTAQLELKPTDLSVLMEDVAQLVKNQTYLNGVEILKEYPATGMMMSADPSLLRQAFFNLCINAIDAMPQGGQLTLRIRQEQCDGSSAGIMTVEVIDTGKGIPEPLLTKIFDPFFTTKEPGKGTGLGLSIVHMILKRHNADIRVRSTIGSGTTFTIKFPINTVAASVAKDSAGKEITQEGGM